VRQILNVVRGYVFLFIYILGSTNGDIEDQRKLLFSRILISLAADLCGGEALFIE